MTTNALIDSEGYALTDADGVAQIDACSPCCAQRDCPSVLLLTPCENIPAQDCFGPLEIAFVCLDDFLGPVLMTDIGEGETRPLIYSPSGFEVPGLPPRKPVDGDVLWFGGFCYNTSGPFLVESVGGDGPILSPTAVGYVPDGQLDGCEELVCRDNRMFIVGKPCIPDLPYLGPKYLVCPNDLDRCVIDGGLPRPVGVDGRCHTFDPAGERITLEEAGADAIILESDEFDNTPNYADCCQCESRFFGGVRCKETEAPTDDPDWTGGAEPCCCPNLDGPQWELVSAESSGSFFGFCTGDYTYSAQDAGNGQIAWTLNASGNCPGLPFTANGTDDYAPLRNESCATTPRDLFNINIEFYQALNAGLSISLSAPCGFVSNLTPAQKAAIGLVVTAVRCTWNCDGSRVEIEVESWNNFGPGGSPQLQGTGSGHIEIRRKTDLPWSCDGGCGQSGAGVSVLLLADEEV